MSLPRYPEYKESGLPWAPEMPSHWTISPLKRVAVLKSGSGITSDEIKDDGDFPVYGGNGVRGYTDRFTLDGEFALIGRQGALCGNINYARGRFWASEHAVVVTPVEDAETRWLGELLRSMNLNQYSVSAAQPGLSVEAISNHRIPVPPPAEQHAIATFLDRETAKIDALIAEQEKLLALLAEKRLATISHAVTRGLNPSAPMKDSGIPWLGEVPAHWDVTPLKYVSRIGNGSTPNRDNPSYWAEEGFPWLNSSVVNQDEVTEAERFVTDLALKECHLPLIEPPAILVGITGQGKTRGMAAPLMFGATINQHLAFIKPEIGRLLADYLLRALEMSYKHLRTDSEGAGSTKGAITCDQLSRFSIPLPPLDEQAAIAKHLDAEAAKFDKLSGDAGQAIDLLRERRSALISAAVTGKIDVRDAA